MKVLIFLITCISITALHLPFHYSLLSEKIENANLKSTSETSCLKTVCFLCSRFTQYSILEVADKLEKMDKKYRGPDVIKQNMANLESLNSILDNPSIQRFIGLIIDVFGNSFHYFFAEKDNNNKVIIYQSFQNSYTLSQSVREEKSFNNHQKFTITN